MGKKELSWRKREQFIEDNGVIFLDNVSKVYSKGAPAINGITLGIGKGEFVFIVGDSGSDASGDGVGDSKRQEMKLLLRELTATSGNVYVMGSDLANLKHRQVPKFRRNLGVVFQDFRLLNDRNVYENVAFAQRIIEIPAREIRRNVPTILATVGLAGKYKAKTRQLSGEQQRVALARALVNKPSILLADEPTGNLDPKNSWEIMMLLDEINQSGTTVVVVTHNREIVNAMHKRVVTMKRGIIISDQEGGEYIDED